MSAIARSRSVLLSSPYADAEDPEILECFPNGPRRSVGMVEVTLENGVTGLGEGYLAVFAPLVFRAIVDLCAPWLQGRDGFDIEGRVRDLRRLCDYWSMQGAARHVISAFEIALQDARAKSLGVPVHAMSESSPPDSLRVYGSGGCCASREAFLREFDLLAARGIDLYKMRSVRHDIHRTAWVLDRAAERGIEVGVDMCQNLADPPQAVAEAVTFIEAVHARTDARMAFVEEAIGPDSPEGFAELRRRTPVPVCGGETITTPRELLDRARSGAFDFVQPDASVIGGIGAVLEVFRGARAAGVDTVVHAWGGAVAIMASYHAAFAAGGELVEWPMLAFPLADEMIGDRARITGGRLQQPTAPGLGVELTAEMERRYPFDESAVYCCLLQDWGPPPDSYWLD